MTTHDAGVGCCVLVQAVLMHVDLVWTTGSAPPENTAKRIFLASLATYSTR